MLKKYIHEWSHKTNKMGLEISERKTKLMLVTRNPYNENKYVKLGTYNFERMEDCVYSGKILTNKNELILETEKELWMQTEHIMHFYLY